MNGDIIGMQGPTMENQMEKNMDNQMDTGIMQWFTGMRVLEAYSPR